MGVLLLPLFLPLPSFPVEQSGQQYDQGLPKPGVAALLSPKLCELTVDVRNQHLLNFNSKIPALLWLQVAFPSS